MRYIPQVDFYNTSTWQEQPWLNSGGTRAKRVLIDHDNQEWYFKCSEFKHARPGKSEKYYKYEFWNEIIAYQIGSLAGLNILRYDVAIYNDEIGCLSKKMVKEKEQLIEVGRFMTANNPDFIPANKKTRNEYTFQLIDDTLQEFKLDNYFGIFLQTMVFDALIGNTDRHQENWAFIGNDGLVSESLAKVESEVKKRGLRAIPWIIRRLGKYIIDPEKRSLNPIGNYVRLSAMNITKMAPIYDSGSSLARELTEEKIHSLLSDEVALENYILSGTSEIHWNRKKISHFDLLGNLCESEFCEQIVNASMFLEVLDRGLTDDIIHKVDTTLPVEWESYRIPNERKELMSKLVASRLEKLKNIFDGRV